LADKVIGVDETDPKPCVHGIRNMAAVKGSLQML